MVSSVLLVDGLVVMQQAKVILLIILTLQSNFFFAIIYWYYYTLCPYLLYSVYPCMHNILFNIFVIVQRESSYYTLINVPLWEYIKVLIKKGMQLKNYY